MAARSVILWLGDELMKSTRPASDLVSYGYDGVQTNSRIWNIQTQAWENLLPGTNTDTVAPGSSTFGPEVRARAALLATIPTGFVDHIKYCVTDSTLTFADLRRNPDGTAAGGTLRPCWYPLARDTTAYSGMLAQVKAAAAAAAGAGDTLVIKHVVISLFLAEIFLGVGWRSYGARMLDLINTLRVDLDALASVDIGTFYNASTGGPLEVTVVAPHAEFSSAYSELQKGIITNMRSQIEAIVSPLFRITVQSTNTLTCTDGLHLDTASLITLGNALPAKFLPPAATNDTGLEVAEVFAILGDSIFDGSGIAPHPTFLTGAQPGVKIWARDTQTWENAQVGANNLVSYFPNAGLLSVDVPFGNHLRNHFGKDIYISKVTQIGSHAAPYPERSVYAIGPLQDSYTFDWHPATTNGLCDLSLSWLTRGAESLRAQSKAPRLNTIAICLGSNDLILPFGLNDHLEVVPSIKQLVRRYIDHAQTLGMVRADQPVKVILAVPTSRIGSPTAPWADGKTVVLRAEFQAWADENLDVRLVDLDPFGTNDGLHLNTQGTIDCALAMFQAWGVSPTSPTTVQPLFVRTKDDLLKALRLSQVPDTNDAKFQIDEAIRNARVNFFTALGASLVNATKAKPFSTQPSTADEIARALASSVEVKMVRAELLRVMPVMFMDGANTVQSWNQEAAFREGSYLQTKSELTRLENEIREGLTMLLSGEIGASQIATLYPDAFFNPGDSLFSGEVI